jgi:hypothetical protein
MGTRNRYKPWFRDEIDGQEKIQQEVARFAKEKRRLYPTDLLKVCSSLDNLYQYEYAEFQRDVIRAFLNATLKESIERIKMMREGGGVGEGGERDG